MKTGNSVILALAILVLMLVVGITITSPALSQSGISSTTDDVAQSISYQGRLMNPSGSPLNGTYTMRFIAYDAEVAGSALWDSSNFDVTVEDGLFTVQLEIDQDWFDGQALWLSITVEGETLSPRQEILPAPYAMSLRPGADIVGESIGSSDAVLSAYAPATGTALYGDANNGVGVFGDSEENYGVWGISNNSYGGFFQSSTDHAVSGMAGDVQGLPTVLGTVGVVGQGATRGVYGASISGPGVYGYSVDNHGGYFQSSNYQAVRGEAGDVQGLPTVIGAVGVVGYGSTRGVQGGSISGNGVYGYSVNNYGGYFYSDSYRGMGSSSDTGYYAGYFTNRGGSTRPGVYINGTLTVTGAKSGFVVDISQNVSTVPLEAGDVVAVVGVGDPVVGEIPVMQVVKASASNASAVVGVVDQRFLVQEENGERVVQPDAVVPRVSTDNPIQNGEYLSVVTLGAFKVIKADASAGSIQPGDLLTPSEIPGYVKKAETGTSGTIVGKALETLESGQGEIAVYVTLH